MEVPNSVLWVRIGCSEILCFKLNTVSTVSSLLKGKREEDSSFSGTVVERVKAQKGRGRKSYKEIKGI